MHYIIIVPPAEQLIQEYTLLKTPDAQVRQAHPCFGPGSGHGLVSAQRSERLDRFPEGSHQLDRPLDLIFDRPEIDGN